MSFILLLKQVEFLFLLPFFLLFLGTSFLCGGDCCFHLFSFFLFSSLAFVRFLCFALLFLVAF